MAQDRGHTRFWCALLWVLNASERSPEEAEPREGLKYFRLILRWIQQDFGLIWNCNIRWCSIMYYPVIIYCNKNIYRYLRASECNRRTGKKPKQDMVDQQQQQQQPTRTVQLGAERAQNTQSYWHHSTKFVTTDIKVLQTQLGLKPRYVSFPCQ